MPAEMPTSDWEQPSTPSPDAEAVFDALVREYYTRLYNFAVRFLGSEQAAEDAVQEVFLKVWSLRSGLSMRDPQAYLYQALRNQCLMAVRRERRWNEVDLDQDVVSLGLPPEGHEAADLEAAVAQAVDALPERCRLIFTMSREQDLSYAEIARILGLSVKTVENQIARALKILRRRLAGLFGLAAVLLSSPSSWPRILG